MDELKKFYDEVAKVAYDLFEIRGKVHGHDMADWLKAEIIVRKRYSDKIEPEAQAAKSKKSGQAR
ncbi:MAG TPA: DUF2934 domain-containing protein [Syntrophales bacterium]|nr:DUF2934 domain-containing protein [Syntrophales bacterium]